LYLYVIGLYLYDIGLVYLYAHRLVLV